MASTISLRQRRRDFTRRRLLEAAGELFARQGTRGTSVENIARMACTSRATFYAHFSDKQDVIRELAQNTLQTAGALYERFGALADWNLITIADWMRQVFAAWERNASTTSAVIEEVPQEFKADF